LSGLRSPQGVFRIEKRKLLKSGSYSAKQAFEKKDTVGIFVGGILKFCRKRNDCSDSGICRRAEEKQRKVKGYFADICFERESGFCYIFY